MDTKRLILAGGLAVAAFVIFTQLRNLQAPAAPSAPIAAPVVKQVEYIDVLVAALDMPFGSRLTAESMQWKPWPTEALSENFITSDNSPEAISENVGSVVRTAMYVGEPLLARKLVAPGDKGVMAALLKPGMRAVTTRISVDTAAGGFIQPGDRVDIILTSEIPVNNIDQQLGNTQARSVSATIFENVHVLAIDQVYATNPEGGAAVVGSTATFELTQGDAELLEEAKTRGDISLTLRGINDARSRYATSAAKISRDNNSVKAPTTIAVYRDGQPQIVALRGN